MCGGLAAGFVLAASNLGQAQNQAPADSTSSDHLIGYTFANDAFFRTDYYFTQGMTLHVMLPVLARSPVNKVLPKSRPGATYFHGLTLHYDGFTPLRIQDGFIRSGDRPYASTLYAAFYRTANDPARRTRFRAGVDLGIIGPPTGAKNFQTYIHERIDSPLPRGWGYQVHTDLVLGYRVSYEQQLAHVGRALEVVGQSEASLGSLYTFASAGALVRVGKMNPYFRTVGVVSSQNQRAGQKIQLYGQAQVTGRLVGYDATLQGGLFNHSSPYTLPAKNIARTVAQGTGSLIMAYGGCSFRATGTWISPEFTGARHHAWGLFGVDVAF